MVTKLQNIISKIEKRHSKKIDLSLDRTFNLLNKLGNPQNKIKNVVTVVGTNSKASMATALSTILKESGYKYNLYTSPHLQSYTERFIFNNKEISENDLAILLEDVDKILGNDNATVFEILTSAFIKYAENFKDNVNIIEAGLFHRFDSTNVFKQNLLTLLGVIHLDHLNWLDNKTIDGVIYEKTSALPTSNIFVNNQMNSEIKIKIKKSLIENKSKKYFFGDDFNVAKSENSFIHYQDELGEIMLPQPNLIGDHQIYNISTSIAATRKIFDISDSNIKNSMKKMRLKGRLEEIKSGKLKSLIGENRLIIDGGHNINSAISISNWVKQQHEKVHLICGMMNDKPHKEFVNQFENSVNSITLIDIPNQEGSISKEEFKKKLGNKNINTAESIEESLLMNSKDKNCIFLCAGSLYLAGEVLNLN
ncbi:bifunctional folylpolyglutamate synthase/dihydrofolate synthase [Candidatus Pelagibacter sp.]|nr:bifunctional folylpolyglutamate synthase/dihydrofolate synthase [Candidatus Pelagibacter sp.]